MTARRRTPRQDADPGQLAHRPGEISDSVDAILQAWAAQRPDLDFSPVGVVTRLERVRAYLESGLAEVFADWGLSAADFQMIVALRRDGHPFLMPQARLMTTLALTSGTVSVRVDRLVKAGIVSRDQDPADGRGSLVTLTAKGLDLFDQVAPVHLANEDRLLSALDEEDRRTLASLLRRLLSSFESGHAAVGRPLGMRLEPAHIARQRRAAVGLSDVPGLLVAELIAGSAAAQAGIARGDLLVAAGCRELRCPADLAAALSGQASGTVLLSLLRGENPHQVSVQLTLS